MKKIISLLVFLTLASVTVNAQSVLERVVNALAGEKKEDPSHKTIDAGGQTALVVPKHVLDHNITWHSWSPSEYSKVSVVSSDKSSATIKGLRSTSSTVVNYKYDYKTIKDGKEVTEHGTYPFTITINRIEPTSITISQETSVGWGLKDYLKPRLKPDYSEVDMQFDSDNPQAVTVNSDGSVYGVALGDAIISIHTANGLSTSTHITCVVPEVSEINIEGLNKKDKLYEGDELDLNYNYAPVHAQAQVTWCSSDESIATVDQQGHVKIVGHGTVHIYCTNNANGVKDDLKLKPKKAK